MTLQSACASTSRQSRCNCHQCMLIEGRRARASIDWAEWEFALAFGESEVETTTLEAAEAEYHALISSVEFAYAFGHGCSIDGGHPRFVAIRERADQLLSIIREHIA